MVHETGIGTLILETFVSRLDYQSVERLPERYYWKLYVDFYRHVYDKYHKDKKTVHLAVKKSYMTAIIDNHRPEKIKST